MATLYVEKVPRDLYAALKRRARTRRTSIASEVVAILRSNVPTEADLRARREVFKMIKKFQAKKPLSDGPFPSTEEMLREDRAR